MQNHEVQGTFLVEHYRPGFAVGQLRTCVETLHAGLQTTAPAPSSTRILCSMIVPEDEAFLVVLQATSEQQVAEAFGRSGVAFDRISPVIAEFSAPEPANPAV